MGQVTKHVERWHVERWTNMSPMHVTLKAGVNTAMIRGKLDWNWLKFYGERNTGFPANTVPPLQTNKQTLTTSKHSIEFTYSDFPCYFKINSDKPELSFRRRKSKTGKMLTITANFQEWNFGTALSGKEIGPVGRIVKSWTGHERMISLIWPVYTEGGCPG